MVQLIDLSPTDIYGHKLGNLPDEKKILFIVLASFFFLLKEIQIVFEIKSNLKILC